MKALREIWKEKGMGAAILGAIPLLLLLQCWRPFFFLTDDSFSLSFPVWVSVGQKIWAGQNPFVSPELFGGNYPLYRDSQMIVLWRPVSLLLSLFSPTFLRNALVDILASAEILLAVSGFRWLLGHWNRAGLIRIAGGQSVFLSLSYGFSMYGLLLGSSGYWYLANVAALPWLVGAWWETSTRRFFIIVILLAFHNAVGGYPSCFIYSMAVVVFFGLWKMGREKDFRPGLRYLIALLVAGLLSLPMMLPSLATLTESTRSGPIAVEIASEHRMPAPVLFASAFFGSGSILFGHFELFGKMVHAYALASFAAGGLALASFWKRKKSWNSWDLALVILMVLVALLVSRPHWLGVVLQQLPVLGSLRWPHKEVFLLVFVLHLWAARGSALGDKARNLAGFAGILLFLASLVLSGPPSLNEHAASRRLLLSGEADRYWAGIQKEMAPGEQLIPLVPEDLMDDVRRYLKVPLILTGGGNFPAMYGVASWSGYSATMPRSVFERQPQPVNVVGLYSAADRKKLAEIPGAVFLEMTAVQPLRIVLMKEGETPRMIRKE